MRAVKNRGRMLVAAGGTLLVRTKVRQWQRVAAAGTPPWDERNKTIVEFIPAGSSVLDIGCGAQTLRQHLKPGCRYQPCDVVKSSPDVILCDFNAGKFPDIKQSFDYVVCSGVFEYIRRPEEFLEQVSGYGRAVILTYNPLPPGGSKLARLGNQLGWVNHFKKTELEALFDGKRLKWTLLHTDKQGCVIYSLESQKPTKV